jgi:hypothetical protein
MHCVVTNDDQIEGFMRAMVRGGGIPSPVLRKGDPIRYSSI